MIGRTRDDYELRLQQALRMRATGRSQSDIGRTIGITTSGVQRMLSRYRKQLERDSLYTGPRPVLIPTDAVPAPCTTDPAAWDLDQATQSQLVAAVDLCTRCPHLNLCSADPHPSPGTVHAGQLISDTGRTTTLDAWARGHRRQAPS